MRSAVGGLESNPLILRSGNDDAHLRTVLDSVADTIVIFDSDERILHWNAGAERIFGYRSDEVVGASIAC
jgi:PAS domain S-box-containing protein